MVVINEVVLATKSQICLGAVDKRSLGNSRENENVDISLITDWSFDIGWENWIVAGIEALSGANGVDSRWEKRLWSAG